MITDALLAIFGNLIIGLVSLLPSASATPGFLESGWNLFSSFFGGMVYALNGADGNSLGTNFAIATGVLVAFEIAYFLWWITKIVINWTRGAGA